MEKRMPDINEMDAGAEYECWLDAITDAELEEFCFPTAPLPPLFGSVPFRVEDYFDI